MSSWATIGTIALGCLVVLYVVRGTFRSRTCYPLPPGPPGLPWIGNVTGIDIAAPWKTYAEWANTYGDIVYSRVFGKDIIIINSEKIAKDLLENRSWNYSDRPDLITVDMCGMGFSSASMRYSDRWRSHRRFFHQTYRLNAVPRFFPLQHRKACHLLRQLVRSPQQFSDHVFEYTASVILNSTYGYDPASGKDEIVDLLANLVNSISIALRPDTSIVASAFPLLLRLPSWFPGMSFKRNMEVLRAASVQYLNRPFEYYLQTASSSSVAPSMVHDALEHMEESPADSWMEMLKEASGTAFVVASETSHSSIMTFFLMMMLNPDAQEKAQAQIDSVVGKGRLPTIDDRPLLPFVDAIYWETHRYNPILPLGVPHAAVHDDMYGGFHIPRGTMLLANLWSMGHDESRFPNPHAFVPERFLNDDGSLKPNEMEHIAFGFGRRICVGRHFADASVWGVIAKVLAVFKIAKALDENGVEIPVEPRFSGGLTSPPLPFKCRIVPRFPGMDAEKLEQLIAASTT